MLKNIKHLLKRLLASNLALALLVMPMPNSMIIPQDQLDSAFNIPKEITLNVQKVQIPINFTYMSQGFSAFHPGIDLATKFGTPIKPIKEGIVIEAGFSPFGYGNEVLIDNGSGMESLYAHLSKIMVKKGDKVSLDSEIGLVGSTGHSTGPHLHLEIHQDDKPVNPITILPPLTNTLITLNQQ